MSFASNTAGTKLNPTLTTNAPANKNKGIKGFFSASPLYTEIKKPKRKPIPKIQSTAKALPKRKIKINVPKIKFNFLLKDFFMKINRLKLFKTLFFVFASPNIHFR